MISRFLKIRSVSMASCSFHRAVYIYVNLLESIASQFLHFADRVTQLVIQNIMILSQS